MIRGQAATAAWLAELTGSDAGGSTVTKYVGTHGLRAIVSGSIRSYEAWMAEAPSFRSSLWAALRDGADISGARGQIRLLNPLTGGVSAGPLESWRGIAFDGHPFTVLRAATSGGVAPTDYSSYATFLTGTIERSQFLGEELIFDIRDNRYKLDRDLSIPKFWGIGPSCTRLVDAVGKPASITFGDIVDHDSDWSYIVHFRPLTGVVSGQRLLFENARINLRTLGSPGTIRLVISEATGGGTVDTTTSFAVDEWAMVAVTHDASAKAIKIYAAVYDADPTLEGSSTYTGTVTTSTNGLEVGKPLTEDMNFDVLAYSRWSSVLTLEEIRQHSRHPLAGNETSLTHYWPLNEGLGTTAQDLGPSTDNGTITNGTWEKSELGGEDLAGVYRPLALGTPRNVEGILSDAERFLVDFTPGVPMRSALEVRLRGAVQTEGASGANYEELAATGQIRVYDTSSQDGKLTADLEGWDDGATYPIDAVAIAKLLLTEYGPFTTGDLVAATWGVGMASTFPNLAPVELWLPAGGNLLASVNALLGPLGGRVYFDASGKLDILRLEAPSGSPDHTLEHRAMHSIRVLEETLPSAYTVVKWGRNYTTQDQADLNTSTTAATRSFIARPWREAKIPLSAAKAARHLSPLRERVIESHLVNSEDGYAEAVRVQEGLESQDGAYRAEVQPGYPVAVLLGEKVLLKSALVGAESAGRLMIVIGLTTDGPYGGFEAWG